MNYQNIPFEKLTDKVTSYFREVAENRDVAKERFEKMSDFYTNPSFDHLIHTVGKYLFTAQESKEREQDKKAKTKILLAFANLSPLCEEGRVTLRQVRNKK